MIELNQMLSNFFQIIKNLPKKRLIILGLFIFSFLLFVIIRSVSSPRLNKKAGSVPQPSFKPFFSEPQQPTTSFKDLFSSTTSQPKTVPVAQVNAPSKDSLQNFFQPIANDLKLGTSATITPSSELQWINGSDYLKVNQQSGQFNLKIHSQNPNTQNPINEIDAVSIAKNWLEKYQLIAPETPYKTSYLESSDNELQPVNEFTPGVYFQFNFSPTINKFPIFSSYQNPSPIIVVVTNQGEIFYISYQLPAIFYHDYLNGPSSLSSAQIPIKSPQEVGEEIKKGLAVITAIATSSGQSLSTDSQIKTVDYQSINLGFKFESAQSSFLPIFQLLGTGTLEDSTTVQVTAYLSAIAD